MARTRVRPLARKAISTQEALAWNLLQAVSTLAVYLWLPGACLTYSIPFFGLHLLYPFAKRFTDHPQLVLGFAYSLGIFVAFPALGQALYPFDSGVPPGNNMGAYSLTAVIVFWTLLNDTIYSAQDVEDDAKAGLA